jgi:ribosomal protein L15
VKLLAEGELSGKVTLKVNKASVEALKKVEST